MRRPAPPILRPGAAERLTALVSSLPSLAALAAAPFSLCALVATHEGTLEELDHIELCAENFAEANALLARITACEFVAFAFSREVVTGVLPRKVAKLADAFDVAHVRLGCDLAHRQAVAAWVVTGAAS